MKLIMQLIILDEVDNATNYIISIKGGSFSEFTDLNGLTETENKNISSK